MNCMDLADVKEEEDLCLSFCEKEEPDFINTREQDQVCCVDKLNGDRFTVNNSEIKTSAFDDESELAESRSTKVIIGADIDSKDNIKEEKFAETAYFIDSTHVSNLSQVDSIDVKIGHENEAGSYMLLEQLLQTRENSSLCYCEHCNFSTVFKGNLSRHMKYKHSFHFNRRNACDLCSFKCAFPGDLRRHLLKHEGKYVYNCYLCDYGINKKHCLDEHMFKKHALDSPKGKFMKTKQCFRCTFKTKVKSHFLTHFLEEHKVIQHGKHKVNRRAINYFDCKLCSFMTTRKRSLIDHIDAKHKNIRPYVCHLCDYAAVRPTDLRLHIFAKHDKITPFKCEYCGYASSYKKHLRRHVITQHIYKKPRKKTNKKNTANYYI